MLQGEITTISAGQAPSRHMNAYEGHISNELPVFRIFYLRQAYRDLALFGLNLDVRSVIPFGNQRRKVFGSVPNFFARLCPKSSFQFIRRLSTSRSGDYRYANLISTSRSYVTIPFGEQGSAGKQPIVCPLFIPISTLEVCFLSNASGKCIYDFTEVRES